MSEVAPARPLAVSVDVTAVPPQPVGAGRYTIDLVTALGGCADVALTLWARRNDDARWAGVGATPDARSAATRPRPPVLEARAPRRRPLRLAWEQVALPRLLRNTPVAVHHGPHYTMPERAPVPCVVTIHDLTFVDHPEWHERSKVLVFRRALGVAARRAEALVCVSSFTAQRLGERFAPRGRVFVVPHGVDHDRFRPDADLGRDEQLRAELGVGGRYLVFIGTLEPRKAVPVLLAAFEQVSTRYPEVKLVVVGRKGWGAAAVERALAQMRARDQVNRLGYVPDEAVPALLRGAMAAVYPAIEEGFGLPALEALTCGTPLVTTSGSAMAELAGSAALLVAPGDAGELADALVEVIGGGETTEDRRRLGLEIAARHTWPASAAGHLEAYRWAASRAAPGRRRRGPRRAAV